MVWRIWISTVRGCYWSVTFITKGNKSVKSVRKRKQCTRHFLCMDRGLILASYMYTMPALAVLSNTVSKPKTLKTSSADIWRRYHWFPCQMTSEKRAHKFHTDDVSLAGSTQIWVLLLIGHAAWEIFFRSYNLHSTTAIRRFLRQPFLK